MMTQSQIREQTHEELDKMAASECYRFARYAIRSESRSLVHEAYGMAKMAYMARVINHDQFFELNTMLVRDTMNNGKLWRTFHV